MTVKATGARLRFIRRGDSISADYLNSVSARADRNARILDQVLTQLPEGQDGAGSAIGSGIYNETSRVTSTVRIEDENDSSIFVEIERIDSVTFSSTAGGILTLNFNNT